MSALEKNNGKDGGCDWDPFFGEGVGAGGEEVGFGSGGGAIREEERRNRLTIFE